MAQLNSQQSANGAKKCLSITSKALAPISHTIYYGTLVHTPSLGSLEALPQAAVLVDQEGTIKDIIRNCQSKDKLQSDLIGKHQLDSSKTKIVDITSNPCQFFFPGFIDTHIHAPQFPNNGIFGNSTLLDWLETYTFPLEASFKDIKKAYSIYSKVVDQTLRNGTTTASYFATIHPEATKLLANICYKVGQRSLIGRVCMDDNSPDFYSESHEELQKNTLEVCGHIKKLQNMLQKYSQDNKQDDCLLVQPTLTPRFAPSCTSKSLSWLGELRSKHNFHVQSHVSENVDEIAMVAKLFPDSKNYTAVYDDHSLLSDKTVLAHGVHLTKDEKNILHKTKTGISHCPISNSSITSGEAKIRVLLDADIKVGLGTDVSGGFSPSILSVARQAHLVSRHLAMKTQQDSDKLSVNDVLYLATAGGAKCLALDSILGDFQIGKKWEAQLVDLRSSGSQMDIFSWQIPSFLLGRGAKQPSHVADALQSPIAVEELLFNVQNDSGAAIGLTNNNDSGFDNAELNKDGTFSENDKQKFEDLIAKWLFNGDDRNTVRVYVNGRCVVNKSS